MHILLAAEDGGIFGHRVGDEGNRLLEMAIEIGPEVRHATLRAVDINHGFFKAETAQRAPQRLAGLGGIDGQRLTLEVELLVFLGRRPLKDFGNLFLGMALLIDTLGLEGLLILRLGKERKTRFDLV